MKLTLLLCVCVGAQLMAEPAGNQGSNECAPTFESLSQGSAEKRSKPSEEEIMRVYLAGAATDPVRVKHEALVNLVASTGILANGNPQSLAIAETLPGVAKFLPKKKSSSTVKTVNRALELQLEVLTDLKDFQMERAFAEEQSLSAANALENTLSNDSAEGKRETIIQTANKIAQNPNLPAGFREFINFYLEQTKASEAPFSPTFPQLLDSFSNLSQ